MARLSINTPVLLTPRLRLEPLELKHGRALLDLLMRNREWQRSWNPIPPADFGLIECFARIRRIQRDVRDGRTIAYMLAHRATGKQIGQIDVLDLDPSPLHRSCNLGYWIDESFGGQGLIREATGRLLWLLFSSLELHRVEIWCHPSNVRSKRIPQYFGFTDEGILRDRVFVDKHWQNLTLFTLLEDEFRTNLDLFREFLEPGLDTIL